MRLLIFKETPFSTVMSIFGAIFVAMGLVVGGFAFDIMFNEMDAKGSVGYWVVALAFAAVGVVFYIAAYKTRRRQWNDVWKRNGNMQRKNLILAQRKKKDKWKHY